MIFLFYKVNIKPKVYDEEDDYDYESLNRIMNVKVHWEKNLIHKFPVRMVIKHMIFVVIFVNKLYYVVSVY